MLTKLFLAIVVICVVPAFAQTLGVTYYDQAPAHMAHARFPSCYWNIKQFYDYPLNGSCGTANNTFGWTNSDFEQPLYVLQGLSACDFNAPIINGEKGLVGRVCTKADGSDTGCGALGSDRTPVYAYNGSSPSGSVSSLSSFHNFFHDTPETIAVAANFTLTLDSNNPRLKTFENLNFFPLDGLGWNDHNSFVNYNGKIVSHNFAWCMALNTHFTYQGGEYLFVIGDDDIFVYINNYLVLDLGGVHTALNGSILADSLGLTQGVTYRFDMFYCERHTTASELSLSTTFDFGCSSAADCNDNNACTADSCSAAGGCSHTAIKCVPKNKCHTASCSAKKGCVQAAIKKCKL